MTNSNTIGNRIKLLREAINETQADLSKVLNVKRETVNQWENNTRDIKTQYTVSLAEHFKTTCDYLLGLTDVKTPNMDTRAICEKTGLTENIIEIIKEVTSTNTNRYILNYLLGSCSSSNSSSSGSYLSGIVNKFKYVYNSYKSMDDSLLLLRSRYEEPLTREDLSILEKDHAIKEKLYSFELWQLQELIKSWIENTTIHQCDTYNFPPDEALDQQWEEFCNRAELYE